MYLFLHSPFSYCTSASLLLPEISNLDSSVNRTFFQSSWNSGTSLTTLSVWPCFPCWAVVYKLIFVLWDLYKKASFWQDLCWLESCVVYLANTASVIKLLFNLSGNLNCLWSSAGVTREAGWSSQNAYGIFFFWIIINSVANNPKFIHKFILTYATQNELGILGYVYYVCVWICNKSQMKSCFWEPKLFTKHKIKIQICHRINKQ